VSFMCILAVHRFVFEGCARRSRGLCTRARRLFLSRHPLSCARLSLSLFPSPSLALSLSLSLPPPFLAFPFDISSPSLLVLRLCQGAVVSLLPLRPLPPRSVMPCPLASSATPLHNLPQTLKRSGLLQGDHVRRSRNRFRFSLLLAPRRFDSRVSKRILGDKFRRRLTSARDLSDEWTAFR